jgi:hypothetical protein
MKIKRSFKHSQTDQMPILFGQNRSRALALSQNFQLPGAAGLCFLICAVPAFAQFSSTTTATFILDGFLYLVASAAYICFCWDIFTPVFQPAGGHHGNRARLDRVRVDPQARAGRTRTTNKGRKRTMKNEFCKLQRAAQVVCLLGLTAAAARMWPSMLPPVA